MLDTNPNVLVSQCSSLVLACRGGCSVVLDELSGVRKV